MDHEEQFMPRVFIQDENVEQSAQAIASSFGLGPRSVKRAVEKLRVRLISNDEKVFTLTRRSGEQLGQFSVSELALATGKPIADVKKQLTSTFGLTTQQGTYGSFIGTAYEFEEKDND
jgi:hypothetical protein